ncbi:NAD-dependent epimerase/dehydratase family protein [Chryseobacterium jejuense]|uniref:Nucleoside-diphosphate-sugar epimerase n=1 Tax=Chryseobacterium jejuense TaxID=445960 RepID=A0A2X2XP58_CHRJE|nr:NAD-dependent epimerase/dehydratase family protein [Chryseobacterium jejuense]SDI86310.1 Nucleoside-diphosphate-sugar epimerase [Chryseobacterium jejuense]SQB27579.1 UDP-glucose 4-epimerase [Chryseobacterium jejuense]
MKKVFVTGATGLLGTNVIIKLLQNGYSVTALVRQKSKYLGEENENLKLIEDSLSSDLSVYLTHVDCVIHIAAETSQNLIRYEDYKKINYDLTVHLFSQAETCGVRRFLFVSSANTIGYGNEKQLGNENELQKYPFTDSFYAQSKLAAENYLLRNQKDMEVIILNPTFMIGAYDTKPSSGKLIFWAWKKKLIFYPKGGKNFVHAEDVANGVVAAIDKGKNGEKYLLAHENLSYREFFNKVNRITHQKPIMIAISNNFLSFLGLVGDGLRKLKIKTNLSTSNMKALQIRNYYSHKKSIEELGIQYQPINKAVEDAVRYFIKNNKS